MTLHRKKPKMARAWWRQGGWVSDEYEKDRLVGPLRAMTRWHKAVKS